MSIILQLTETYKLPCSSSSNILVDDKYWQPKLIRKSAAPLSSSMSFFHI